MSGRPRTRFGSGKPVLSCWRGAWLVLLAILAGGSCRKAEESPPGATSLPVVTTKTDAEMVLIPAGRFTMGSRDGKPDEAPAHEVAIDAFWMDRTEVTQEQYGKLVLANPSHFKGPDRPVEQVSWAAAAKYCNERSRDEGLDPCYDEETAQCNLQANGYRLPTEAEWEYACRAGVEGDYCFGSDGRLLKDYAWHAANASRKTQPVAQKKLNAWGLFDVHGNVAEWCNDVYAADYYEQSPADNPRGPADGEKYVLRGGAWNSSPEACRSPARVGEDPGFQDACFARDAIGFRCVRRAPAAAAKPPEKATEKPSEKQSEPRGDAVSKDQTSSEDSHRPSKVGFVYGEIYLRHKTGPSHPERPERLAAIVSRLEETGLLARLVRLDPAPAPVGWLTAVHDAGYVQRVRETCLAGSGYLDSTDTPVMRDSYEAAVAAAGGVMAAVDAVVGGKATSAFCAVRPPGHHASRDKAMGFCLLNNVAIAARYAQRQHKLANVLIVDWDVHHGNGTQAIFDDDPSVLYFSVHQAPFYPFTGCADDRGAGKATGTKINVPLRAGSGNAEYRKAFEETLRPAALAFRPDLVLISAGFDAHEDDLLGQMKVSTEGFAELTRIVRRIAEQCCGGRLVSVLEGGYNLSALAEAAEAHVRALMQ